MLDLDKPQLRTLLEGLDLLRVHGCREEKGTIDLHDYASVMKLRDAPLDEIDGKRSDQIEVVQSSNPKW